MADFLLIPLIIFNEFNITIENNSWQSDKTDYVCYCQMQPWSEKIEYKVNQGERIQIECPETQFRAVYCSAADKLSD